MGVPFGAFVGQRLGWHAPFAFIALIGLLALLPASGSWCRVFPSQRPRLVAELRTLGSGPVVLSLLTTLLGFGGVFVLFTYIAPLLRQVRGFAPPAVAAIFVLFGVGTLVGNLAAGKAADRSLGRTLLVTIGGLAVILAVSSFMWPSMRRSRSSRRLPSASSVSLPRRRCNCSSFAQQAKPQTLLRRRTSAPSISATL